MVSFWEHFLYWQGYQVSDVMARLVEVISHWMVQDFSFNVSPVVSQPLAKLSFGLTYIDKFPAFATCQFIDHICTFTIKGSCDFPRFSTPVTLVTCGWITLYAGVTGTFRTCAGSEPILRSAGLSVIKLSSH